MRIGNTLVARSDEKTTPKLREQIDEIRVKHRVEYDKLLSDMAQDEKLLESFQRQLAAIIFKIENYQRLNGQCEYELSLKK